MSTFAIRILNGTGTYPFTMETVEADTFQVSSKGFYVFLRGDIEFAWYPIDRTLISEEIAAVMPTIKEYRLAGNMQ